MKWLETKIPPVILWAVCAFGVKLTDHLMPFTIVPSSVGQILMWAFQGLALAIIVAGIWQFRKSRTTVNPHTVSDASSLVDGGIYRFTRNPMYLGMAVSLTGLALYYSMITGIAWLIVFFDLYDPISDKTGRTGTFKNIRPGIRGVLPGRKTLDLRF